MNRRRGFSLVECALSIVVIGGLLAATMQAVGQVGKARAIAAARARAWPVATSLLEEITSLAYLEPGQTSSGIGLESGESADDRTTWDDVDDANGYKGAATMRDGTALPGGDGLTVVVSVEWVSLADGRTPSAVDTRVKLITVTVSDARGEAARASGLRTGAFDSSVDATLGRRPDPSSRREAETIK